MSLEKRLVASALKSRAAALPIIDHVNKETLTVYSQKILSLVEEFYEKDPSAQKVDEEYILGKLDLDIENQARKDVHVQLLRECIGLDVSAINTAQLLLDTQRKEMAAALAQKITNGGFGNEQLINEIDKFKQLLGTSATAEDGDDTEIYHNVSVETINKEVLTDEGRIKLLSPKFTEEIGGGALRGHHILILARPETGKTATVLSMAGSLAVQKLRGIYFGNEDPLRSIVERFQGCLSRMPRLDRLKDPEAANTVLKHKGYEYVKFVSITPGSVEEINKRVEQEKPDWIIVDQIRNLRTKAENRTNQLETIATDLRTVAKKHDCLVISVTQAGDSASNKLILEMGDVDSSNTGIPAQMDLMVGIGLNKDYDEQGLRRISFCKNKLSGRHTYFDMRINTQLSRLEDI